MNFSASKTYYLKLVTGLSLCLLFLCFSRSIADINISSPVKVQTGPLLKVQMPYTEYPELKKKRLFVSFRVQVSLGKYSTIST